MPFLELIGVRFLLIVFCLSCIDEMKVRLLFCRVVNENDDEKLLLFCASQGDLTLLIV